MDNGRGGLEEEGRENENFNPNISVRKSVDTEAFSKQCPSAADSNQGKDNFVHVSNEVLVSSKETSGFISSGVFAERKLNSSIPSSPTFHVVESPVVEGHKTVQETEPLVDMLLKEKSGDDVSQTSFYALSSHSKNDADCSVFPPAVCGGECPVDVTGDDFSAAAKASSVFSVVLNSEVSEVSSCGFPFLKDDSDALEIQNSAAGPEGVGEEGAEVMFDVFSSLMLFILGFEDICLVQWGTHAFARSNFHSTLVLDVIPDIVRFSAISRRCTESFMQENVVDEMRQMQSDDETKRKMLDILKRFHSQEEVDSMDENESIISEETIQKVLSDGVRLNGGQVNFEDLSADEKKLFQRAMASGELSKMIEPWDPWWLKPSARTISLSKQGTQLVQLVSKQEASVPSDEDLVSNESGEIPPGPETPLCPVSKLSSTEPSPLLAIHLVDIIYSYCLTLRVYNGDWQSDALGSAMMVLTVSSVLGQGRQPETIREALSYCLEQTCSSYKHMGGLQFGLAIIDDVVSLLSLGGSALVCSLCDLQRLIQAGEKDLKSDKASKFRKSEIRNKLKLAERKIYFIMCWVREQPGEAWSSSVAILTAERISFTDHGGGKSSVKTDGSKAESRGKITIEEMK
ncbi:hypothetical protein JRO89_XS05G0211300 [Xanthoceras sorbifolium]|uniref:Shq1 protein domain-containing protein n=1 Tax=Xanthoceras sorbifolium TaxID=99658 RepID=A0ABQ8I2K2_9ROSI|nr:hypothetical protein JRO89_XS05G0211300 [Xanthoceras sorbifolium]